MTSSILTKLSLAVVATMITLSPALADKRHHSHGYSQQGAYYKYQKRKQVQKFYGHRHHAHRSWKPRFYSWKYASKPNRHWR